MKKFLFFATFAFAMFAVTSCGGEDLKENPESGHENNHSTSGSISNESNFFVGNWEVSISGGEYGFPWSATLSENGDIILVYSYEMLKGKWSYDEKERKIETSINNMTLFNVVKSNDGWTANTRDNNKVSARKRADDDYAVNHHTKNIWQSLEGRKFSFSPADGLIDYLEFNYDGTGRIAQYTLDDIIIREKYKLSYSSDFTYQKYPDESSHNYKIYLSRSNQTFWAHMYILNSYPDYSYFRLIESLEVLIADEKTFKDQKAARDINSFPTSEYIKPDGTPYNIDNGDDNSDGNNDETPTNEWVRVSASGYAPYSYCPTTGKTFPSRIIEDPDVEAYKNTSTNEYKVVYVKKEYSAHKGYNKIRMSESAHSEYNSQYKYWFTCIDPEYYEFTIYE